MQAGRRFSRRAWGDDQVRAGKDFGEEPFPPGQRILQSCIERLVHPAAFHNQVQGLRADLVRVLIGDMPQGGRGAVGQIRLLDFHQAVQQFFIRFNNVNA